MNATVIVFNEKIVKFERKTYLDPRSKGVFLLVVVIGILYSMNLYLLVGLAYLSLILSILSKIQVKHLLISSIFLTLFSIIATVLAYYASDTFNQNPYKFFLVFVSRFLGIFAISAWFFLTVEPYELAIVLEKMFIPAKLVWFIIMIYQFIPVVTKEAQEINDIRRLKGLNARKWQIKNQARILKKTLKPLISGSINRGVDLAESMVIRGFEPRRRKVHVLSVRMKLQDGLLIIASITALVFIFIYL